MSGLIERLDALYEFAKTDGIDDMPEAIAEARDVLILVRRFFAGDYPNPHSLAKGDPCKCCPHGNVRSEDCWNCDDEFLGPVLEAITPTDEEVKP